MFVSPFLNVSFVEIINSKKQNVFRLTRTSLIHKSNRSGKHLKNNNPIIKKCYHFRLLFMCVCVHFVDKRVLIYDLLNNDKLHLTEVMAFFEYFS